MEMLNDAIMLASNVALNDLAGANSSAACIQWMRWI